MLSINRLYVLKLKRTSRKRKISILLIILTILTLLITNHEYRSGYIATPFERPWIPRIPFMTPNYYIKDPLTLMKPMKVEELGNATPLSSITKARPFIQEFKNPCYLRKDEDIIFGNILGNSISKSEIDRADLTSIDYIENEDGRVSKGILRCLPNYFVLGKLTLLLYIRFFINTSSNPFI